MLPSGLNSYNKCIELVTRHWSGKHKRVVSGINLITLLCTDGERYLPIDYRIYNKFVDALTKNSHFSDMLRRAAERGFAPETVLFGSWHSGLENLKLIRPFGWRWLTRLKFNRHMNPDRTGSRPLCEVELSESVEIVHLKGYGMIKVFKKVRTDDDFECWATNDLKMTDLLRLKYAEISGMIETYHGGVKQFCGIEQCQARSERAQRNRIEMASRAFLRIENISLSRESLGFRQRFQLSAMLSAAYLAKPTYGLEPINLYATA